jgi:hypothetical protein
VFFNYPGAGGTQDSGVRSDVVHFTTIGGGAVFLGQLDRLVRESFLEQLQ